MGWLPAYLNEQFHLDQGTAGLSATGYLFIASLLGVLFGGGWADRWSRTNQRARILVPLLGLCVAAPAVLLAAQTSLLVVAIAGMTIYGFTRVFGDANMMPMLCLVADPRYRATGYGVLNLFSCVIGGLAIYAGGKLLDHGLSLDHSVPVLGGHPGRLRLFLLPVMPRHLSENLRIVAPPCGDLPMHAADLIWSATPTPFLADGSLDDRGLERVVAQHGRLGVRGLFLGGTCGEGPFMPNAQRAELVRKIRRIGGPELHLAVQVSDTSAGGCVRTWPKPSTRGPTRS